MIKIILLFSLFSATSFAQESPVFPIDKAAMLKNVNSQIISLGAFKKCLKGQTKQSAFDECLRQYIVREKDAPKKFIIKK